MSEKEIHELFTKLQETDFKERTNVRVQIISESEKLTTPEPLFKYLNSDNGVVRRFAAEALGKINDERSVQYLDNRLAEEMDKQVQMAILYALRDLYVF